MIEMNTNRFEVNPSDTLDDVYTSYDLAEDIVRIIKENIEQHHPNRSPYAGYSYAVNAILEHLRQCEFIK